MSPRASSRLKVWEHFSKTERTHYIARVRNMARACAQAYVKQREALGYPLVKDPVLRAKLNLDQAKEEE